MINGDGMDLLHNVGALLDGPHRDTIMRLAERTVAWMENGAIGRRSHRNLAEHRAELRTFNAVADADPVAIEIALLRAQREMSDEPLTLRIGVSEVAKQARATDDLWTSNDLPVQRGAGRARDGRLMLVTSKVLGVPTLPGATAVIERRHYPDVPVTHVIRTIREADPEARIVDVDLDYFVSCVAAARREQAQAFTLRVPGLVSSTQNLTGPLALHLESVPQISNTPVSGAARDIKGLRVGLRGGWSGPYAATVEEAGDDGAVVVRPVTVRVSDELVVKVPTRHFQARVARVAFDRRTLVRATRESVLVAVMGEDDPATIAELAAKTVSATDEHPHVAELLETRSAGRVFQGEQQTRHALHVDRAIASVAIAAHLLNQHKLVGV